MGIIRITPKEFELIVRLDLQQQEIIEELGISIFSYKKRMHRLFKKLGVKTRTAVIIKALKSNIVKLEHFDSYYN